MEGAKKTIKQMQDELEDLRYQLFEATEIIEAIRTGQVDALVVHDGNSHQLYTLKTADHAYRVIIEKMTEGAITLNREGIILYCNSKFASIVQLPISNVIGLSFENFLMPEYLPSYNGLLQKCWEEDCKLEVELKSKEHATPVQLSVTPLEVEENLSLSVILTDLTAQKQAQAQLQQNNRQLEEINHALELSNNDLQQFASVASHDLQEPLRKIQMFSNLLKDQTDTNVNTESKKYIEKIIDSAGRMKSLIVDVLNYSKLSANHNTFENVDLNNIFEDLLEDFELISEEKNVKITIDTLPHIEINRGQIRQAFQNIISNAIKFSKKDKSPVIHIKSKRVSNKTFESPEDENGPYCFISVKDNGIGFDQEYANNIFSLFERLHSKDEYEGTGIGLAITKKIIEKHNGLITARSEKEKGSEFLIILPVTQ